MVQEATIKSDTGSIRDRGCTARRTYSAISVVWMLNLYPLASPSSRKNGL